MVHLLEGLIQRKGWKKQMSRNRLFLVWEEIVGPEVAVHAQPSVIRGKTLWLNVSDSVWMQQLHYQQLAILDEINRRLPKNGITGIRFKIDSTLGQNQPEPPPENKPTCEPDLQKQEKFDDMLSSLKDKEMRRVIKDLWLRLEKARA